MKGAQSCPRLCNHMDCSPPGSSVHGILQARILEWVTISFCRGSSQRRDHTWISCLAGGFFTVWATRAALLIRSSRAGFLTLQNLMPDDLRWSWCNNKRNKVHNKCNALESSQKHATPPPTPVCGKIVSHETGPWCQKCRGPLISGSWVSLGNQVWLSKLKWIKSK